MGILQIIEIVAATIGILYVILEVRASHWLWPVGVVLPLFYIYLSWQGELYGNIIVNLYYLGAAIWGWWLWTKRSNETPEEDRITTLSIRQRWRALILALLLIVVAASLFRSFMESPYPWGDATATVISCFGMWFLAKKQIENWYCWISSNAIYCVLFYLQAMHTTALFYLVYTLCAVWGLLHWRKMYRDQDPLVRQ